MGEKIRYLNIGSNVCDPELILLLAKGDIIHVEALGTRIYYVNSLSAVLELFEKRSALYSDRPILTMACEL